MLNVQPMVLVALMSTYALMAAGVLGLGFQAWRRRKAAAKA